jgi:DNA polymerase-1
MEDLYLIDASSYLYSAYFAIRNLTNDQGESTNALHGFISSLEKLAKDFRPKAMAVIFDGPNNSKSRIEIYPAYKAHRQTMPPDLRYQIAWAQEYCTLAGVPWLSVPEVEADDTIGSIAAWAKLSGTNVFMCSNDKDLCQCIDDRVRMLSTLKDNRLMGPMEVEETYGVPPSSIVDYLALVGDASDNVPGLPGFGPKGAAKLLRQFGTLEKILSHPEEISEAKKRAIVEEQGDLARISRKLVTIDTHVAVPMDDNFYTPQLPQWDELKAFYQKMSFHNRLRELDKRQREHIPAAACEYILVDDEDALAHLIGLLSKQSDICFSVEAEGTRPWSATLLGISFAIAEGKAWYIPAHGALGIAHVVAAVKPLFANEAIAFCSHQIKLAMHVLANHDIHIAAISFDTILANYLLNSQGRQHSLPNLMLDHFGVAKSEITPLLGKGKSALIARELPPSAICPISCEQADYIWRCRQLLARQIDDRQLAKLFYDIELPLVRILFEMERRGIYVDRNSLQTLGDDVAGQLVDLQASIFALAGEEFNINSPKQLGAIFAKLEIKTGKKTATGQVKTDSDVLEGLKAKYPIAHLLLEYRALEKLRSTYIQALPAEINPATNRIHCTFNQVVAATGRLSCQEPNLQNIPTRTPMGRRIREAFRPEREGWSFLAADYSQIELRLLAHFSEDPNLLYAFGSNQDVHAHTASIIFNVPIESVTPEMRYQAKAVNFGIIYGQQAFGLAQELSISVGEAAQFIERYFQRYSFVQRFLETYKESARQTGKATTLFGRERSIPEILSKNSHLRSLAERLAINTPLQGSAADLIKMAMLRADKQFAALRLQGYMVLQVHDELIFELPDSEIPQAEKVVREAMEGVAALKVPLTVHITIGKNWKEC